MKVKTSFPLNSKALLSYVELPYYRRQVENIYIKQGYHPPPKNWLEVWSLLWSIHSETINIWSHLVGSLLFLYYFIDTILYNEENDHWVTAFYDFSAFTGFTLSTFYHLLRVCSNSCENNCFFLDTIGIQLVGYAKAIRFTSYFFDLNNGSFYSYLMMNTITFGTASIFCYRLWAKNDYSKNMKMSSNEKIRILFVLLHPMLVFVAMHHRQYNFDIKLTPLEELRWGSVMFSMANMALTLLIFAVRFPECIFPGKFDTYFNSHQIMHVMLVFVCVYVRYS